jgi:uncharacterized protein YeaO (DUF488 family)
VKKTTLLIDEWTKLLAPSTELRRKFGHDPRRWKEFQKHYRTELRSKEAKEKIHSLAKLSRRHTLTLVYSARDEKHNDAVVLKSVISRAAKSRAAR